MRPARGRARYRNAPSSVNRSGCPCPVPPGRGVRHMVGARQVGEREQAEVVEEGVRRAPQLRAVGAVSPRSTNGSKIGCSTAAPRRSPISARVTGWCNATAVNASNAARGSVRSRRSTAASWGARSGASEPLAASATSLSRPRKHPATAATTARTSGGDPAPMSSRRPSCVEVMGSGLARSKASSRSSLVQDKGLLVSATPP